MTLAAVLSVKLNSVGFFALVLKRTVMSNNTTSNEPIHFIPARNKSIHKATVPGRREQCTMHL
jgi:hypothetical protein